MKKITLLILLIFAIVNSSLGQVGVFVDFNNSTNLPVGWTNPVGFFTSLNTAACQGNSVRSNLYAQVPTSTFISPNYVAGSNGSDLTFSFDYKVVQYSLPTTPTAAGWGSLFVETSANNGTTWSIAYTINNANHVVANTCANVSFTIPGSDLPSGSDLKFRFRGVWTTGDYFIYLDNISITQITNSPPNCDAALTSPLNGATNASLNGIISWSPATGIATDYELSVGTSAGGSEVLAATNVGNVTSYTVANLLGSTQYFVRIVPLNNNGSASGCTEYSFTTVTPPANDNCSGAVGLTVNPALTCTSVSAGTIAGASASTTSTTACSGSEDDDVWFSFVATDVRHRLVLSSVVGSTTFLEHSLWTGLDCDNLTLVSGTCSTLNSTTATNLTIGSTYYFRVYSNTATPNQNTTFNVCVGTLPPPIVGSLCSNPIIVTLPYTTTNNTANYEASNYTGSAGATGCGNAAPAAAYLGGNDVVYAYTATITGSIKLNLTTPQTWVGLFAYASCSTIGTSCLAGGVNGFDGGPINILDFPVVDGLTYYFVISTYPAPDTASYTLSILENTCTNAAATYAITSDCDNAPQFFVNVNVTSLGSATSVTVSDNQASTSQNITAPGLVTFGPYPNATPVIFKLTNDQDSNCIVTSPAKTQVACPATNDECATAISLTVNPDLSCAVTTPGNVIGATASPVNATSCSGSEDDDVWFSFVATATTHPISLLNVAGSDLDMFHSLWTGPDCGNLTLVANTCSDPNSSNPVGLTIGETYYLRVYTYTATAGQTSTFNVCIGTLPPPPVNDNLCGAIEITVGTSSTGTAYNNIATAGEVSEPTGSCFNGGINGSVWFSFVAPASGNVKVTTDIAGGSLTDTEIAVYNGTGVTCSDLSTLGTAIGCDQDSGEIVPPGEFGSFLSIVNLPTLTAGNTYYVQVDRWSTATNGTFGLSIIDNTLASTAFDTNGFSSYPNPVVDILNLSYSKNIDKVQIVNLLGQEVVTKVINATDAKVDMSQLASGTYMVRVTSDNQVKTLKVVKQ